MEYVQFDDLNPTDKKIVARAIVEDAGKAEKYSNIGEQSVAKELIQVGAYSLIKTTGYIRVVKGLISINR